jgi:hypothetical protein
MVRIYLLTKAHVDQATEAMLLSYTVFFEAALLLGLLTKPFFFAIR